MSSAILSPALLALAVLIALLGLAFARASAGALLSGRLFSFAVRMLWTLLFAALGVVCFVVIGGTQGYRALTREEIACEVTVEPTAKQAFLAHFVFPDGRQETHALSGDELYVDAHILKWKPWLNILGLHTSYQLDRVAGRYASLDDERGKPRTVASLAPSKSMGFDLFDVRRRYERFGLLVDARYGSATFIDADDVQASETFEVRVSTTGLLIRRKHRGL